MIHNFHSFSFLSTRLVHSQLKAECLERSSELCCDQLLSLVAMEMAEDISQEVFEVDVVAKRDRLEETERCVKLMRRRNIFQVISYI